MCMAVVFCQLSPDAAGSLHLLAAYEGGHVVLWDAKQPQAPIASIRGHEEPVMALALQPSGKGGRPPCVCHDHEQLWLLEPSNSLQLLADKLCGVFWVAVHAQASDANAGAFSGAADDQLCCWQVTAEAPHLRLQTKLPLKQKGIAEIAVRQDGRMLASAGWDGRVRIFRCAKPKPLAVLQVQR